MCSLAFTSWDSPVSGECVTVSIFSHFQVRCSSIHKNTKGSKERFLIRQNKTGCEFSRKSSFSKLRPIQKQTNNLSLQESKWQKISCLFVLPCFVHIVLKKRISSNLRILSCFVWLKSVLFNLLCVFGWFFSERRQSTLFQFFLNFRCSSGGVVFVDPPWLVFGNRITCAHYEILRLLSIHYVRVIAFPIWEWVFRSCESNLLGYSLCQSKLSR